jgi:site-specific recombinase XerD
MQKTLGAAPKKGGVKSVGQKRPFTEQQVQLIRFSLIEYTKAHTEFPLHHRGVRDLALFEAAISTCLRASDLLRLKVDQAAGGSFPMKQGKTDKAMLVRVNGRAKEAIATWVQLANLGPGSRLWPIKRREYSDIVKSWAKLAHLDPKHYSTHSMRRTMPAHLYAKTNNVKAASELLGHVDTRNTGRYLGLDTVEAHKLAEEHDL